ncbi:MAG: hypothetical protein IPL28_01650 [Chloroflexi bacterium]|nr:hypothetical protein [Chloroflexota bacterium]
MSYFTLSWEGYVMQNGRSRENGRFIFPSPSPKNLQLAPHPPPLWV